MFLRHRKESVPLHPAAASVCSYCLSKVLPVGPMGDVAGPPDSMICGQMISSVRLTAPRKSVMLGLRRCRATEMAPADSPNAVTCASEHTKYAAYLLWVAAKRCNVVSDPLEGGDLVVHAEVAGPLSAKTFP